ncbi:MAG: flap structure-specific endonuclease, partial [bacterium]
EVEEQMLGLPEEDRFDWKEIFQLFHKPAVVDAEFKFGNIDEEKIKEILVDRHDFSEERVEKQLEKLRKIKEKGKQKGLGDWI